MELREGIARMASWNGWRRYGPAAGSVATHAAIGVALATLLAAANRPSQMGDRMRLLDVTLIAEEALTPPMMTPSTPNPPQKSRPTDEVLPDTQPAPKRQARKQKQAAAPDLAEDPAASEDDGVYVGPAIAARSGVPLGLRSLLETDPCNPLEGKPRGDCRRDWAALMERGDLSITPSYMRLRELYPGFQAPDRQTRRTSGVFRPGGPMPGGPAGAGGVNDLVGRVPRRPDNGFGD